MFRRRSNSLTAALALAIVLSAPLATAADQREAPAERGWWKSLVEAALATLPNQLQCDLGPYIGSSGRCESIRRARDVKSFQILCDLGPSIDPLGRCES